MHLFDLTPEQYRRAQEEELADYSMERWLKDNDLTVQGHVRDLVATFPKDTWAKEGYQAQERRQAIIGLQQRLFGNWRLQQRRLIEQRCRAYAQEWEAERERRQVQAQRDLPRLHAEYGGPVDVTLLGLVAHTLGSDSRPMPSAELEVIEVTSEEFAILVA